MARGSQEYLDPVDFLKTGIAMKMKWENWNKEGWILGRHSSSARLRLKVRFKHENQCIWEKVVKPELSVLVYLLTLP